MDGYKVAGYRYNLFAPASNMVLTEYIGLPVVSLFFLIFWRFFRSSLSHIPGPPSASWWKGELMSFCLSPVSQYVYRRKSLATVQCECVELPRVFIQDIRVRLEGPGAFQRKMLRVKSSSSSQ